MTFYIDLTITQSSQRISQSSLSFFALKDASLHRVKTKNELQ